MDSLDALSNSLEGGSNAPDPFSQVVDRLRRAHGSRLENLQLGLLPLAVRDLVRLRDLDDARRKEYLRTELGEKPLEGEERFALESAIDAFEAVIYLDPALESRTNKAWGKGDVNISGDANATFQEELAKTDIPTPETADVLEETKVEPSSVISAATIRNAVRGLLDMTGVTVPSWTSIKTYGWEAAKLLVKNRKTILGLFDLGKDMISRLIDLLETKVSSDNEAQTDDDGEEEEEDD